MEDTHGAESRILVLGIGNTLLKDEGVGVRAVEELRRTYLFPPNVEVLDGGTAGLDLLDFMDGASHVVVVDCVLAEQEPGTVLRMPLDRPEFPAGIPQSLHDIGMLETLGVLEMLGRRPWVVLVGMQPQEIALGLDLSPRAQGALGTLVRAVARELEQLGVRLLPSPPGFPSSPDHRAP